MVARLARQAALDGCGQLRYHVGRSDGEVEGRIEVAQRLKRLDTTIGKLAREKGGVTQMHDIGGVRAVLPTQRHIYVIEEFGRRHDVALKFGAGDERTKRGFRRGADLIADFDRAELTPEALAQALMSLPSWIEQQRTRGRSE